MKVELIYKDFLVATKEMTRANNLLVDESRSLLAHLEKSTRDILESCKNNMDMHKANSKNLQTLLEKIELSGNSG